MSFLTPAQAKLVRALVRLIGALGRSPSVRELAADLGLWRDVVYRRLMRLKTLGIVWHERGQQDWQLTGEGMTVYDDLKETEQ